jgi:hypothetical protein
VRGRHFYKDYLAQIFQQWTELSIEVQARFILRA